AERRRTPPALPAPEPRRYRPPPDRSPNFGPGCGNWPENRWPLPAAALLKHSPLHSWPEPALPPWTWYTVPPDHLQLNRQHIPPANLGSDAAGEAYGNILHSVPLHPDKGQ